MTPRRARLRSQRAKMCLLRPSGRPSVQGWRRTGGTGVGNPSGLEDLVDLIYQAAIDTALWSDALERIVGLVGAEAGTLHCYDMFSGASTGVGARVDQVALDRAFAAF